MDDEKLIELAVQNLSRHRDDFNRENFDRITVKRDKGCGCESCDDPGEESYWVSFIMSERFIPMNSRFVYGVGTNPQEGMSSIETQGNPRDLSVPGRTPYFVPTPESRKALVFVKMALKEKTDSEFTDDLKIPEGQILNVRDGPEAYGVEIVADYWDYSCRIRKSDGAVLDEMTADLVIPEEFDEDCDEEED